MASRTKKQKKGARAKVRKPKHAPKSPHPASSADRRRPAEKAGKKHSTPKKRRGVLSKVSAKVKEGNARAAQLIGKGKERGFVTYDEILREFPHIEDDIFFWTRSTRSSIKRV